jgi:hypothetical protein
LISQLRANSQKHLDGGVLLDGKHLGLSTDTWRNASSYVYRRIDDSDERLLVSPPVGRTASKISGVEKVIDPQLLTPGGILFVNLHDHRTQPRWWGEQRLAGFPIRTPDVVDLELANQVDFESTIIFCEACYGAAIDRRTPANSLALCSLNRKATAFFGCAGKSYAITVRGREVHFESGIDALFGNQ